MTDAARDRLLVLSIPRAGVSVAACALGVGKLEDVGRARLGVDFSAPREAPSDQRIRLDGDALDDEALALKLLDAALRVAQPLVESRLKTLGIEGAVTQEVVPGVPSDGGGSGGGCHG